MKSSPVHAQQRRNPRNRFLSGQNIARNWHKPLILLMALYLLPGEDIRLQIRMGAAHLSGSLPEPVAVGTNYTPSENPGPDNRMSILDWIKSTEAEVTLKDQPQGENQTAQNVSLSESSTVKDSDNAANHYRNLTFVLNPDYARRKAVPDAVVEEKMAKCRNYIKRFGPVAVREMKKYGIPASIKLAQGLLESDVGESRLARTANNHFGIKCFSRSCSKGHCANYTDDSHKDFFRIYGSAWESYRAHSRFLQGSRYAHLKSLGVADYKGWAYGLKKAGYATDPRYPQKLIRIIEELRLHELDQ